ncbi:MAG: chorismate mutase [Corallococcus sp.]|nr:chorismate mutase [Bacillota bacterium]MCM1533538.1 chorismate mutase [Corallococcus sp.]
MGAIRGAICALNTEKDISEKSVRMLSEILKMNSLKPNEISAVFFSVTDDLDACYPAKAVREHFGMRQAAFMCFREMSVKNALSRCIRVCVFTDKILQKDCKHCYLGKAATLRPDLA